MASAGAFVLRNHECMDSLPLIPSPRGRSLHRTRGFTLVELMVTLAIAAILVALAVPSMTSFLAEQAAAGNADELAAAFRFARSEAIKRSASITVCASSDGQACGQDWKAGWIVTTSSGTVLRVQNGLAAMSSLTGGVDTATFTSTGLVTGLTDGSSSFTFVPTGGDTSLQRVVQLDVQGKVKVTKGVE